MYCLVILKSAADDLKASSDWYELQQKGLEKKFQRRVLHKLVNIQNNPLLYPVKFSEEFRFARVNVFPFFIVFEVVGNEVRVNSIFHTSRSPVNF